MWMGTKLPLLQESGQGRLEWQTSKPAKSEIITPAKKCKGPRQDGPKTHRSLTDETPDKYQSQKKKLPTMGGQKWKD